MLTEFSMLLSIPSNKKAASVQTLCIEEVTVPQEAGTPNMNVQMESKSNCKGWKRRKMTWNNPLLLCNCILLFITDTIHSFGSIQKISCFTSSKLYHQTSYDGHVSLKKISFNRELLQLQLSPSHTYKVCKCFETKDLSANVLHNQLNWLTSSSKTHTVSHRKKIDMNNINKSSCIFQQV